MVSGTDAEIFGETESNRKANGKGGRPAYDREFIKALIQGDYSTQYIRRRVKDSKGRPISDSTLDRIRKEMLEAGELAKATYDLDKSERNFDQECKATVGFSFRDWLITRAGDYGKHHVFPFCQKVWLEIWDKPPVALLRDMNNPLADQCAQKFLSMFGADAKRIRRRKKQIRFFFRFIGRSDICDRHLTMSRSRDLIEIRELPEIAMLGFAQKLEKALIRIGKEFSPIVELSLRLKIVTQMRTGERSTGKELMGTRKGGNRESGGSYIVMNGPEDMVWSVNAKRNERWNIQWVPMDLRKQIYVHYQTVKDGEPLFAYDLNKALRLWKQITESEGLPPLRFHDLRKVSITWFWACGIPLEIAVSLNVGWRDLNTPKDHYLQFRQLLGKDKRLAFRSEIPDWFKQGLEQYMEI